MLYGRTIAVVAVAVPVAVAADVGRWDVGCWMDGCWTNRSGKGNSKTCIVIGSCHYDVMDLRSS